MKKHIGNIDTINELISKGEIYEKEDGLLYCSKCDRKVSQRAFPVGTYILSKCAECSGVSFDNATEKAWKFRHDVAERKKDCFSDKRSLDNTFEKDNGSNKTASAVIVENYLKNFDEYRENGKGLLLWGASGTGKTFYADAILHRLIEIGYKAKKYNLPKQISVFRNKQYTEDTISELKKYNVVCIDDLGAEKETSSMIEFVYSVINELYAQKIPVIFTTNLKYEEMKKCPADKGLGRIYSRVVGSCFPIEVNKTNQRIEEIKGVAPVWNERNAQLRNQGAFNE